jgi:hypothetical protein
MYKIMAVSDSLIQPYRMCLEMISVQELNHRSYHDQNKYDEEWDDGYI